MSSFGGLVLTNKGKTLQSKAQTGVQMNFTRISIGDGNLGSQSILALNSLVSEVKSLNITKLKFVGSGRSVVGGTLSNQEITAGFYFRELGVFADDPDLGEILYCYGNAGELAEYIPSGGQDIIEKTIDLDMFIGNAENVTSAIDESLVFATVQQIQSHIDDVENPHAVTKTQIGLGNLINKKQATKEEFQDLNAKYTTFKDFGKLADVFLTYENGVIIKVEEKEDDVVVKTTNLIYTSDVLTSVVEKTDGKTVTTQMNYSPNGELISVNKEVS